MTNSSARAILVRSGALLTGHFHLNSGRHSDTYVNKDAVFANPHDLSELCKKLAGRRWAEDIDVTVGPVAGGVALSSWTAYHMNTYRRIFNMDPVLAAYADKVEGKKDEFELRRGYDQLVDGQNVLLVEDILTTGGSINGVRKAVIAAGGKPVRVAALCNRGGVTRSQVGNLPIYALTKVRADSWPPDACMLCEQGVPVNTNVGKGREFLAAQAAN